MYSQPEPLVLTVVHDLIFEFFQNWRLDHIVKSSAKYGFLIHRLVVVKILPSETTGARALIATLHPIAPNPTIPSFFPQGLHLGTILTVDEEKVLQRAQESAERLYQDIPR